MRALALLAATLAGCYDVNLLVRDTDSDGSSQGQGPGDGPDFGPDFGAARPDLSVCSPGFADCNRNASDGCEANLRSDADHCGDCNVACSRNHVTTPACAGGLCSGACDAGFLDCNGDKQKDGCEVSQLVDPANCGGCSLACSSMGVVAAACRGGSCVSVCAPGLADCNRDKRNDGCETDVRSDPANCGSCGAACSQSHMTSVSCAGGLCSGTCADGWADCNGDKRRDGCERAVLGSDALNCGGCGLACSTNNVQSASCAGGVCTSACRSGFADCNMNKLLDGCEVSTDNDPKNCGGCGVACSQSGVQQMMCAAGKCNGTCQMGYGDCNMNKQTDGCEVNFATDAMNCGGCGRACSGNNIATPVCTASVCAGACNAGFSDCNNDKLKDGCEINTAIDARHCGTCMTDCSKTAALKCIAGVCGCASVADCVAAFADSCANGACSCGGGPLCGGVTRCAGGACKLVAGQPCSRNADCASGLCNLSGMCA